LIVYLVISLSTIYLPGNFDYFILQRKEDDVGQDKDILGNDITTQDIGPFEYDGTEYNWTKK
jgi:hypothetical protein